jgi:type II secretory pathway pseudopilin PulG
MDLNSSLRHSQSRNRREERGYVLLSLLLMVTLLVVGFAVLLPAFTFEMKRDQEQELIHRGVQYSRAIRAYYKKFGRYPTRLEDLDNTNNLRFLRRRYKDPINQKDFKLLHLGEQGVTLAGGIAGGMIPGATPAGAMNGQNGSGLNGSGLGGGSSFGSSPGGLSSSGSGFSGSGLNGSGSNGVNSNGVFAQSSPGGFAANSNSQTGATGTNASSSSSSDPSQSSTQGVSQAPGTTTAPGDTSLGSQQIIASGPIVGVESISKKDSIREFNHKKKYNEWQFVYDPTLDRGGLISTPNQPSLQTSSIQPGQTGQPGSNNGSAFGPSSGSAFGTSSGFGSGMNGPGTPPPQPPSNPPSPQ